MNSVICAINLRCIPDSLGRGTIEAEIITEKSKVCASVPAQPSRLFVKEPSLAIADATLSVVPNLIGVSTLWQKQFDELLYEIDGTDNFSQIGANLAFALSLANAKAAASDLGLPLWKYLGGVFSECIPRPLGNVISNGVHIKNAAEIQGFLVVPVGAKTVAESIFANVKVYNAVKKMLDARQIYCLVGDNGALAPDISNDVAFEILSDAISTVSDDVGFEISGGIDVNAGRLYDEATGVYKKPDGTVRTSEEQVTYIADLIDEFGLVYVEDPIYEGDFETFADLTTEVGNRALICGDGLFKADEKCIMAGSAYNSANCMLIRPEVTGTITNTVSVINLARVNGMETVIGNCPGETEDTAAAHIGCASGSVFIKTGIVGGESIAKLNELIRIEEIMHERK